MAKRDKLTHRQKRQVEQKQRQRISKKSKAPEFEDLSAPIDGIIVSRFGEQADVINLTDSKKYRCFLRQNLGAPVAGDKVQFRLDNNQQGIVEALYERTSILQRPAQHQGVKPIVANIEQVLIVTAPLPDFSSVLLDRYLVAVENAGLSAIIIANKWDLENEIKAQQISQQLALYEKLGYPVCKVSANKQLGIETIQQIAKDKRSILVGQSGVGKSSIINCMFPEQSSLVNQISENSRLGQHTTTASQLFLFANAEGYEKAEGFIVDSPGVREFGLWHLEQEEIIAGFKEFQPLIGTCKFRDCKHLHEPGCEILAAVKNGLIEQSRWENFGRIMNSLDV